MVLFKNVTWYQILTGSCTCTYYIIFGFVFIKCLIICKMGVSSRMHNRGEMIKYLQSAYYNTWQKAGDEKTFLIVTICCCKFCQTAFILGCWPQCVSLALSWTISIFFSQVYCFIISLSSLKFYFYGALLIFWRRSIPRKLFYHSYFNFCSIDQRISKFLSVNPIIIMWLMSWGI